MQLFREEEAVQRGTYPLLSLALLEGLLDCLHVDILGVNWLKGKTGGLLNRLGMGAGQ